MANADEVDLSAIDPIVVSLMLSLVLRAPATRVSPTDDGVGIHRTARSVVHADRRRRVRPMNRKG